MRIHTKSQLLAYVGLAASAFPGWATAAGDFEGPLGSKGRWAMEVTVGMSQQVGRRRSQLSQHGQWRHSRL